MAMFHTKVKLYLEANSKTWEGEFKKGDTYHIIFNDDETGFTKWDVDGLAQPTADQIASYETAGNAAEKLPVVLRGNISAINTIKKGINILIWSIFLDESIILRDLIIIAKKIAIDINKPIKPNSFEICK